MRELLKPITLAILTLSALPALADGDIEHGIKEFGKCKACHSIVDGDKVIQKGGRVGPNLFGVIGRPAGSYEGFKYSPDMLAAGKAGLVWDTENLPQFIKDPKTFLREYLGKGTAKSKMTYKLKDGRDVAAYLESLNS
ncbi:c-type cytochrome [Frigidibacter sp. ROC022]|uniref:c-type cytochrome n=1 Tax=Frigidibacter sp. ROC022 TaxID=2971796 RepID=UPI00215AA56F|nr:c-type cytochrome [Frigidibacter sp. ROC022]MCR8725270.1 c-type cytochrome [Frigidibacter sp. ROC022]